MKLTKWKSIFEKINSYFWAEADGFIFNEAVLNPVYLNEIQKYFNEIENKIVGQNFRNIKQLLIKLNGLFLKYKIMFVFDEKYNKNHEKVREYPLGISGSGYLNNRFFLSLSYIKIYCNEYLHKISKNNKMYYAFVNNIIRFIGHELIHREQATTIENAKIRHKEIESDKNDFIKYLSTDKEIMCRAWQIIEEFRFDGLKDKQILNILKNRKTFDSIAYSQCLMLYIKYFKNDKKVLKLLYKYIYMYLTNQISN